jgi:hypothetical protein
MIKQESRSLGGDGTVATAASSSMNTMIQNPAHNTDLNGHTNHTTGTCSPPANHQSSSIPKCMCTWKNCRAYQKAWREANHTIFDGVVKIKFIKDHVESMALKLCVDRLLQVPDHKRNEWKSSNTTENTSNSNLQQQEYMKYVIARHHFTEKHILKHLQDPKSFSFLKPFSIHGATKYLFSVNPMDTIQNATDAPAADDDTLLYLQAPNVPKEVVKEEFYRVMEKVKMQKKQPTPASPTKSSSPKKEPAPKKSNQTSDNNSVAASLHHKEIENRILKDQLDAMKSQLTFLHDMVQKLQEQHLSDQQSVYTGRSSRYQGGGGRSRGGSVARNPKQRRSATGVPHVIELGDDDEVDAATVGDWTDNNNSESFNDMDSMMQMDDDEKTTNTFQAKYRLSRQGSGSSVTSKAASTIVSASKSVKTLPREIELEEDDSGSHESLQEEAFDNRSMASSAYGGGGSLHSRRSIVLDASGHLHPPVARSGLFAEPPLPGGPSAMSAGTRKSIGPNSKKPSRRISNGSHSQQSRKLSADTKGSHNSASVGDTGAYSVKDMIVTDPYGEKGLYTGSISSSTGMPNGYGRLEYDKAGRWYEGDWKHGRWTGRGQLSNGDGDFYEGGLKNDHKHGFGKMKFADGRTFEGEYINGQMVEGKMTYQDESTYSGSWVDGMRHGRGRCVFPDESIYEGEFKEGEFFGYGKMSWNDGGWYEGTWLNGEMHGRGREVRADGSLRHDGEWLKGQPMRNKKSTGA